MSKEKNEISSSKKPSPSMMAKMINFFGGVKEFNSAMALFGPSLIRILESQSVNNQNITGTFQLGTGALLLSGNALFYNKGDDSMHSRMGMITGGLKALFGISMISIGLARTLQLDKASGISSTLTYLNYSIKTLSTVIDLFNAAVYGKQALSDSRQLSYRPNPE